NILDELGRYPAQTRHLKKYADVVHLLVDVIDVVTIVRKGQTVKKRDASRGNDLQVFAGGYLPEPDALLTGVIHHVREVFTVGRNSCSQRVPGSGESRQLYRFKRWPQTTPPHDY